MSDAETGPEPMRIERDGDALRFFWNHVEVTEAEWDANERRVSAEWDAKHRPKILELAASLSPNDIKSLARFLGYDRAAFDELNYPWLAEQGRLDGAKR